MVKKLFLTFILTLASASVVLASNGTGGYTLYPHSNGSAPSVVSSSKYISIDSSADTNSSDYFGMVPDPFPDNAFPWVSLYPQNATTSYGSLATGNAITFNSTSSNSTVYFTSIILQSGNIGFGVYFQCGTTIFSAIGPANTEYVSGPVVLRCPTGQALTLTNGSTGNIIYNIIWAQPWYDQSTSSLPVSLNSDNPNVMSTSTDAIILHGGEFIFLLLVLGLFVFTGYFFFKLVQK